MQVPAPESATKTCPQCAEEIKAAALVCRYCGFRFSSASDEVTRQQTTVEPEPRRRPQELKQYPSRESPARREADRAKMLAAGWYVRSEGDDGQGGYNVIYVPGPDWDGRKVETTRGPAGGDGLHVAQSVISRSTLGLILEIAGLAISAIGFLLPGINWIVAIGGAVIAVAGQALTAIGQPPDAELAGVTDRWTRAAVVRRYTNDNRGMERANTEAALLAQHGYQPVGQSSDGGHINLGRTVTGAVLTGGVSVLFGGSRSKGSIHITYARRT